MAVRTTTLIMLPRQRAMTGGNTDPFTSYDLGILRVPIIYIIMYIYIYMYIDMYIYIYIPGFRSRSIFTVNVWPFEWRTSQICCGAGPKFQGTCHHATMQKSRLNMSSASAMSDIFLELLLWNIMNSSDLSRWPAIFFLSLVVSPPQDPGDPI